MSTAPHGTIRLPDGRSLAYDLYGDEGGPPLLFCHGQPGSRLQGRYYDAAARSVGVRLVAPDRPGYGHSDRAPNATLLGWAEDVAALADSLGLGRFLLLGVSGGGPAAAAVAYALPERVLRAAFVAPMGPLDLPGALGGVRLANRVLFRVAGVAPGLVGALLGRMLGADPQALRRRLLGTLPPADAAVLRDDLVWELILADLGEALRRGPQAAAHDLLLFQRPWGFSLDRLRVPTMLWHGERDTTVPFSLGRAMAARLPGCVATFLPEEGHFSLIVRRAHEVLARLTVG